MSKALTGADARNQSILNPDTINTPLGTLIDFMAGKPCQSPSAENFALQSQIADTLDAMAAFIAQTLKNDRGYQDFGPFNSEQIAGVLELCSSLTRFTRDVSEAVSLNEDEARYE